MKSIIKIPKSVQQTAMKKSVDGIIDILLRMYEAYVGEMDFGNFCIHVQSLSAEEFYKLPIKEKN